MRTAILTDKYPLTFAAAQRIHGEYEMFFAKRCTDYSLEMHEERWGDAMSHVVASDHQEEGNLLKNLGYWLKNMQPVHTLMDHASHVDHFKLIMDGNVMVNNIEATDYGLKYLFDGFMMCAIVFDMDKGEFIDVQDFNDEGSIAEQLAQHSWKVYPHPVFIAQGLWEFIDG